jgi:hypothetical protein
MRHTSTPALRRVCSMPWNVSFTHQCQVSRFVCYRTTTRREKQGKPSQIHQIASSEEGAEQEPCSNVVRGN